MIWHLIAAIFAGLGAAGIALLLRTLSGKRLPRWLVPVCAGLGMLGYQVYYEYAWFTHKQSQLPASAEVVSQQREAMFWRPWTYLVPMTTRFHVIDHAHRTLREVDGEPLAEFQLYRFDKGYVDRVSHQPYLLNCATRELVPLDAERRTPLTDRLERLATTAPLLAAACTPP